MQTQMGWLIAEMSYFPYHHKESVGKLVAIEGLEHYEAALRLGKGVLFLTAHTSAWELLNLGFFAQGMHFLARPIRNPLMDNLIKRYRRFAGNYPINVSHSLREVLKVLSVGGTVVIFMDVDAGKKGIFVDFFGKPASSPTGLATIALKTSAAVVPVFIVWDENTKKYRIKIHPALKLIDTGNKKADIYENTKRFNVIIEQQIREFPDQWYWWYKRWRSRPKES